MSDQINTPGPNFAGAVVTLGAGATSWFAHTLVYIQWFAGAVAIIVGLVTVGHIIKHWNRPRQ